MNPRMREDEFRDRLTKMVRRAVRKHYVRDDYTVEYNGYETDIFSASIPTI
jgi:hypothetical protein